MYTDVGTGQDLLQKGQTDGPGQIQSECHVGYYKLAKDQLIQGGMTQLTLNSCVYTMK